MWGTFIPKSLSSQSGVYPPQLNENEKDKKKIQNSNIRDTKTVMDQCKFAKLYVNDHSFDRGGPLLIPERKST